MLHYARIFFILAAHKKNVSTAILTRKNGCSNIILPADGMVLRRSYG